MGMIRAIRNKYREWSTGNYGKYLKPGLKIVVTIACLLWVMRKISFTQALSVIAHSNWYFVALAVLAFMISKLISSFRLNIYFRNIDIRLPEINNIKLYWLGMFYNLFLPGSISGDAYKVVRLTREFQVPYKKTTAAVLLDRFSGLIALGLIMAGYGAFVLKNRWYELLLGAGAIVSVLGLYVIIRFFLRSFIPGFLPTFLLGIAVQILQVLCIFFVMRALNITDHYNEYIFIFLIASVVAVLPFTIGGLGARELVFLYASQYFGLLRETAVLISLLFYLVTVLSSIWGVIFVYIDPLGDDFNPLADRI